MSDSTENETPKYETEISAEEEEALIAKTKEGDFQSFGELVRVYQGRLRAYTARYVNDPNDVYDLVQDAFLNAYKNIHKFEKGKPFWPWIRTICRNRTLNFFRSQKRSHTVTLSIFDEFLATHVADEEEDDTEETEIQIRALKSCITKLASGKQELLRLRYHVGTSVKDIATRYGQSAAGVSMKLMRIRSALKKCMEKEVKLVEG